LLGVVLLWSFSLDAAALLLQLASARQSAEQQQIAVEP